MKDKLTAAISLIISIIAICMVLLRIEPINWDAAGVMVGVLGILVTVLIGWQIFYLFDIKDNENRLRKYRDDIERNTNNNFLQLYSTMHGRSRKSGTPVEYISDALFLIHYLIEVNNISHANSVMDVLIQEIPEKLSVTSFEKSQMAFAFYRIKGVKFVKHYKELEDRINSAAVISLSNISQTDFD